MPSRHRVAAPLALLLALALLSLPRPAPAAPAAPGAPEPALAAALAERLDRLAGPGAPPVATQVRAAGGWVFGTLARPSPDAHAAPLAYLFLAEPADGGWLAALEGEPELAGLLRRAPEGLLAEAERAALGGAALMAGGGEALLSLPFAVGESWYLTGGPHPSGFDGGAAWSALDFAGGSGVVRAAREGVAFVPCANLVKVYHPDGFQTGYYHLSDIQVLSGQPVERGAPLGRISNAVGCGGQSFGNHVHFWLMRGGDQAIQGVTIGGWTVQAGAAPYQGCMARGEVTLCAGAGRVTNDGAIGAGGPPALANPSFEDGASPAPWQPNGPCGYAAPDDPQRARDGARYLAAAAPPGSGCISLLQNIAAMPEPNATYRLAVWARSGDGAPRRATLALWALGPTPRPASVELPLGAEGWRCYEVALSLDATAYSGLRAELYMHTADGGPYHVDAAALVRGDGALCPPAERYRAAVVGLEHPPALAPGATGTITVTLRNTGEAAWDESTMLAPLPRDSPPALAEAGWPLGGTRIASVAGVAPGEERAVSFTVRAPDQPGVYSFSLGLVQEEVAWFAEPGEGAALVTVSVGDPRPPEPLFLPLLQ